MEHQRVESKQQSSDSNEILNDSYSSGMKTKLIRIFTLLILLIASASVTKAQPTSSLLSGKVLDEKELPVQGVTVQITYLPWNKTRDAVTNKKGYFCIGNLPPGGPYSVKFSCNGYEVQTREVSTLDLGNDNKLSLHMRPESNENQSNDAIVSLSVNKDVVATKNSAL